MKIIKDLRYKEYGEKGFSIVELLIVIVVIAVIASITMLSYTGVRNRAKGETAETNAASVKKVAEAYFNANNVYPSTRAQFSTTFTTMPSEITLMTSGSLTAASGENTIMYRYVNSSGAVGACIMYWDYSPPSGSPGVTVHARLGTATSANCNATTGTFPT